MSNSLKELQRILQMLSDDPQDRIQDYRDLIYDYAEAQVEGKDVAILFSEVHAYLEDFDDEHYQAVFSLLEAEKYGRLEVLPAEYRFDVQKVLPPGIKEPGPFVVARPSNGGTIIAWITETFLETFLETFSTNSAPVQTAFVRGVGNDLFKLESTVDERDNSKVTIEATQIDDNDEDCSLTVQFSPEGMAWPKLGGTTVRLTDTETQQEIDEQATDPFGKVRFDQVALAKLGKIAIEIEG